MTLLDKGERGGWSIRFQVRMGDFRIVEEEGNTHGREILGRQLRNKEIQGGGLADRPLPLALLFAILNSSEAKESIQRFPV